MCFEFLLAYPFVIMVYLEHIASDVKGLKFYFVIFTIVNNSNLTFLKNKYIIHKMIYIFSEKRDLTH